MLHVIQMLVQMFVLIVYATRVTDACADRIYYTCYRCLLVVYATRVTDAC